MEEKALFRVCCRDPLGPPFAVNLVWAQRVQALSAAVADPHGDVRLVPIAFADASTPRPLRRSATPEEARACKEALRQSNLNTRAHAALQELQTQRAEENGGAAPALHVLVDGSYTHRALLRRLPEHTTLIGRIRKDAKLHARPPAQPARGRRRLYGEELPTPEQLRQDPTVP